MKIQTNTMLANYTALITFLLGTVIFILYYFTQDILYLLLGYIYIIFAGIVNIVILMYIILKNKKDVPGKGKQYKSYLAMLLNIPVLLIYCWISMILMNTMRVTFINSTPADLTNIEIIGCDNKTISELGKGKSKTVWINIENDCSIEIRYSINGQQREETVVGYTTISNGHIVEYDITDEE